MTIQSLYKTYNRFKTLQTNKISSLPIVILMPHSACNCRCVMCDIWKGNHHLKQLNEEDVSQLLGSLKTYGTQQVLMSGGEALLNPHFFRFCEILKKENIRISLLSTGLTLKRNAAQLVKWVDDIIVSLDGGETLHDTIRNVPGAFQKMKEGIAEIRSIQPGYPISGRTVIHRLNYREWPGIIETAKQIGLDKISFLPADISSNAFNREIAWTSEKQDEILIPASELQWLQEMVDKIITGYVDEFKSHYISESPIKLQKIYEHYAAHHGLQAFPYKKCNAPWVSTVIEADGTVRPCFFHEALGNIKGNSLEEIINSDKSVSFRKELDMAQNETCKKCVCYLHLPPGRKI